MLHGVLSHYVCATAATVAASASRLVGLARPPVWRLDGEPSPQMSTPTTPAAGHAMDGRGLGTQPPALCPRLTPGTLLDGGRVRASEGE